MKIRLLLLLSLFSMTKTAVQETQEQQEPKGLLEKDSNFRKFMAKYDEFGAAGEFNDIKLLASFAKTIDYYKQHTIEGFLFKDFLSNFLFNLLKKATYQIRHPEEAFDYICKLEKNLFKLKLEHLIIQYQNAVISRNLNGLLNLCKELQTLINDYRSILYRSDPKSGSIYGDFYEYLKPLKANAEFEAFKLRYINLESIDSEEKFYECKEKMELIRNLCDRKYLSPTQELKFYDIIKKLAETTYGSRMTFYEPFYLKKNLYLHFGKPISKEEQPIARRTSWSFGK